MYNSDVKLYTSVSLHSTTGPGCIRSCIGLLDGDYQSCDSCDVYVSCAGGYRYGNRPCPASLVWDDYNKRCDHSSATCITPKGKTIRKEASKASMHYLLLISHFSDIIIVKS